MLLGGGLCCKGGLGLCSLHHQRVGPPLPTPPCTCSIYNLYLLIWVWFPDQSSPLISVAAAPSVSQKKLSCTLDTPTCSICYWKVHPLLTQLDCFPFYLLPHPLSCQWSHPRELGLYIKLPESGGLVWTYPMVPSVHFALAMPLTLLVIMPSLVSIGVMW